MGVQEPFDAIDQLDAKDQFETIECLLKHAANPNAMDMSKTPMLIHPLQRNGPWNVKLVDILCRYGCNLKAKVGDTSQTLYAYAKDNCVDDKILGVITKYYKNGKSKQSKKKQIDKKKCSQETVVETVEINVATNPALTQVIKTKPVVKKSYNRKRKGR